MTTHALTPTLAGRFARLALRCIGREYPYHPAHVITGPADARTPRALHPAFYGCFDWHSAVHGHWLLAHLLRRFPDLPEADEIRAGLAADLTEANLAAETAYFQEPGRAGFERTYGWAWLLKLAEALLDWDDPDGRRWSAALAPLVDVIVARYLDFLPRQTYPIRTGTHPNTAFGLAFALDYAAAVGHTELRDLVRQRSLDYYAADQGCPAGWEPGGNDFFSPCLMEADLLRRVLLPAEFAGWLGRFLPHLVTGEIGRLSAPATVTDRADGQLVHLDGLNLSRAWCMWSIAAALPLGDPRRLVLTGSAARHADAGLAGVTSGDYMGEHWLATFAVFALECAEAYHRSRADIRIRPATAADSAGIAQVQVASYRSAYADILPPDYLAGFTEEDQMADWQAWIPDHPDDILVVAAASDDAIVGYALARPGSEPATGYASEIIALHVRRDHQNHGIGRRLVAAAAGALRDAGCPSLMLWTLGPNPVRAWYERLGGQLLAEKPWDGNEEFGQSITEVAYGWRDIEALCLRSRVSERVK